MLHGNTPSQVGYYAKLEEFSNNSADVTRVGPSGDQQVFIDNALAAAGYKIATNATPEGQNAEFTNDQEEQKKYRRLAHSFMLATAAENFQQRLANSNLSDISIHNGVMQIEGEDGQQRNATIEEKIVLEDNSGQNSMHLTQDEIDMNKYLNDSTMTEIPEALQNLAKEKGLDPSQVGREEYKRLIEDKMPGQAPRINASTDINAPITMDSIDQLREESKISSNPMDVSNKIKLPGMKDDFNAEIVRPATPNAPAPSTVAQPLTPQQNAGLTPNTPNAF